MSQKSKNMQHTVLSTCRRCPFQDSIAATVDKSGKLLLPVQLEKPFISANALFGNLLQPGASVTILASKDYAFAHEAGVYVADTDEVWFTSNLLKNGDGRRVEVSRVDIDTGVVTVVDVPTLRLGNGACPYNGGILFCDQGSMDAPSQLVWISPQCSSKTEVLLDNYAGRAFNSLNDVIALDHPAGELIFFTDPPYGREQGFRPSCQMPPAVHCFDPFTGSVRMVADGLAHPNGIAFSPDGETCYVTDTSHINGSGVLDPSLPSTIYAYDVYRPASAPNVPSLRNRRLFGFADCGVPDGIKCDTQGNVYAGCGDGIHVWSPEGVQLGKILLGLREGNKTDGCANFCFVPGGRMVCFAEDKIYLVDGLAFEGALLK